MARIVNLSKKGDKIKELIDELVSLKQTPVTTPAPVSDNKKTKLADIDFNSLSNAEIIKIQSKLSRLLQKRFVK
jgi:hypothetical protein